MKLPTLLVAVALFFATALYAQDSAQQSPPPGAQGAEPQGMPEHHGMGDRHGMSEMHQQHMKEMQANLEKMHALLNDMRTKAAALSAKEKAPMMDNVEMWQMMLDHLDSMVKHMQEMQGHPMHHDGMMRPHGGTGQGQPEEPCCDEPAPAQPPQGPPPTK